MPTTSTHQQEFAALLAIHASRGQTPRGQQPSEEELVLLLDGRLDFTRKQEIYSHLNANPALYRQWLQLVESSAPAPAPQASGNTTPLPWLRWLTVSGLLAGLAAFVVIVPRKVDQTTPPAAQSEIVESQKPQIVEQPQTAGRQMILPESTRAALKGMLDTLAPAHSAYRAHLALLAGNTAQAPDLYAFGASLGRLHNACTSGGKVGEQLRARIRSQARQIHWQPGALSLTMARMGIEQDLCALATELREEIFAIEVQQ